MKHLPFLLAILLAGQAALALQPGDPVAPEAIGKAESIQGELPTAWEPGKLYLLECWATWCGPCLAAIPHVNALHKAYAGKGLRVVGMNVWEDGKDKVAAFVKQKGDGMAYPVAYVGRGGAFENDWLKAAGVRGIPHAFLVKDGKLLLTSHPMQLTEKMIEDLLAGGAAADAAIASIAKQKEERESISRLLQEFRTAKGKKDAAAMESNLAALEKFGETTARMLPGMRLDLAVTKGDWANATKLLDSLPDGPQSLMPMAQLAVSVDSEGGSVPEEFRKSLTSRLSKAMDANEASPSLRLVLARLQWGLGEKDAALASAKQAAEAHGRMPKEPFDRFVKALEEGKLPTQQEVNGWFREAISAQAPKPEAEPKP